MLARLLALLTLAAPASGAPPDAQARLQAARAEVQRLADRGGWRSLPAGPLVRPGEADPEQVPALRRRLALAGDLGRAAPTGDALDPALADALRAVQRRHGLDDDGVLGPNTRAALDTPAAARLAAIDAGLAALARLDLPASGRWVLVNVPEYRVRAFDGGREVMTMKAVVGADRDGWRTPTFRDHIEYVEFRPTWNVPTSIALNELAPQGAAALAAQGFELVRQFAPDAEVHAMTEENLDRLRDGHLLIRQAAGPENPLGRLKVMFPNGHNVYLHDTPARSYFARDLRALSHGCVRLEAPARLAGWLLGWQDAEVEAAMSAGPTRRADLAAPVPVVLAAIPAWADDAGRVWYAGPGYSG